MSAGFDRVDAPCRDNKTPLPCKKKNNLGDFSECKTLIKSQIIKWVFFSKSG
jgi:hypothetical protein